VVIRVYIAYEKDNDTPAIDKAIITYLCSS